jgi:multidrug efflux pump subunit AcrA (membrane-fusion protein)
MRPSFRSDLTCSREEQQGVVFYRIDDPRSQTSFRLYEIEYLIAKKLDGSRSLGEVITAVKKEFNFDISEPDLQRFVNQLESMGFLHAGTPSGEHPAQPEQETAVMERPAEPVDDLEILEPEPLDAPDVDQAELDRLLRSAFLHVKQGYIVHARDYFLAAKELNPTDERLTKLVHHLEIIGDSSGPAEVEYLWKQATELFPDVAEEVGPLIDAKSGAPAAQVIETPAVSMPSGDEDIKSRVVWALVALVVLAGGAGGLIYVLTQHGGRIFGTAARVRVTTLRSERIPIYYDTPATSIQPLNEKWLSFDSEGKVGDVLVEPSSRVDKGAVLMSLVLPERLDKQLTKVKRNVSKAQANLDKVAGRVEKLVAEREAVETERTAAEDKLRELRPKSVLKQGGVSKRDLEKWKAVKVEANKKLSRLKKKERGPRKQLVKAQKKRDAALKKLDALQQKLSDKLIRAPFEGIVAEVKASVGQQVKPNYKVLLIRDPFVVRITFLLDSRPSLEVGGQAYVAVSRGKPNEARVVRMDARDQGVQVAIKMTDPSGAFAAIEPNEFRLVEQYADSAFRIPLGAIIDSGDGTRILIASQKRAFERAVKVVKQEATSAVIQDKSGSLRDGAKVVTSHLDGGKLEDIPDGSFLETEGE